MKEIKKSFFTLTAKVVIVNDKNEILLIRRSKTDKTAPGKYDLPGGRIEADENIEEALVREIKEEVGLEVKMGPVLFVFDFGKRHDEEYEIGDEKFLVKGKGVRFLAYYKEGEISLSFEHDEYLWLDFEKALEKFGDSDFEKDKIESIKKAEKYLEMQGSLEGWKRCMADFENYKKRQAEDRKDMIAFSNMNLILEILPILDNFYASTEFVPEDQKENQWVIGIMHIQKQLEKVLEDNGVNEIVVKAGDEFDPNIMEAIENDSKNIKKSDNKVEKVLVKGYKIGGKVIRAAKVAVK